MLRQTILASHIAAYALLGILHASQAHAVNVAERNIGDALIFPYYTVRDGWDTLFNITNASANTVALKVRFHEAHNSRDVLDFNLVMSPYDVWTGWVTETVDGQPRLYTTDGSCSSPQWYVDENGMAHLDLTNAGYVTPFADGGTSDIDRAREGYVEVLMMGAAPPGFETAVDNGDPEYPTVYYANHETLDCDKVDAAFVANSQPNNGCGLADDDDIDGNPAAECDFIRNTNALKGNFSLINAASGIGAGGNAVTLANYRTIWNAAIFGGPNSFDPNNAITAQDYPYFLDPTLDSADPIGPFTLDDPPIFLGLPEILGNPLLAGIANLHFGRGVDAVSFALRGASLINEWSVNPTTGSATDWTVTFPTKAFYVDIDDNPQAAVNPDRYNCQVGSNNGEEVWNCDLDGDGQNDHEIDPSEPLPWVFDTTATTGGNIDLPAIHVELFSETFTDGNSCDKVKFVLYDREEGGAETSGTLPSPAPATATNALCYEANVVTFAPSSVLGSQLSHEVDISVLKSGSTFGWMRLEVADSLIDLANGNIDQPIPKFFMPGIGFAFKARDFGNESLNFGQLMDHSAPKPFEQLIMDNLGELGLLLLQ